MNVAKSKSALVRCIPASLPYWYRVKKSKWWVIFAASRNSLRDHSIQEIINDLVTQLEALRFGVRVYDGYRKTHFTVKTVFYGLTGDLVAKKELAGFLYGGFSKVKKWCVCCKSEQSEKMRTVTHKDSILREKNEIIASQLAIENCKNGSQILE